MSIEQKRQGDVIEITPAMFEAGAMWIGERSEASPAHLAVGSLVEILRAAGFVVTFVDGASQHIYASK